MARRGAWILAFASLFPPLSGLGAAPPRPAPPVYASHQYVLTFRSPPGTTYCPLPPGWVGSDHGTILFLEPPRDCAGAGFPSISRGYAPADVARIELFYRYADPDESPQPRQCRKFGRLAFLGGSRTLCRRDAGAMISLDVAARYSAGTGAQAVLTLWSRPARLAGDLAVFRRLAAGLRTCTSTLRDPQGAAHSWGGGPPCARSGWF